MKWIFSLALIWLLTWAAGPAVGEMYYWTDENGIRHYSNQAPPTGDVDYGTSSEIEFDAEADRERTARQEETLDEMRREREAEKAAEERRKEQEAQAATEEERERLEADKRAVEEKLYDKRRASRSRMQKAIRRVVEIDERIEALESSGESPAEINALKAERRSLVEQFYRNSRRWKRGGQADLKEHQEIQEQLDALEQKE